MLNFIFAHAGEDHSTEVETVVHELSWYVQLPIFFVVTALVAYIAWLITKKHDTTILITSTLLLVAGFAFFSVAPLVSILSITLGMTATLLVTLIGLGQKPKAK
jgi:ABC-type proline/glycine betaine transport system permease subunit